jgi:hypothetical protein
MTHQLSLSDIGARLPTDYQPRWLAYCRAIGIAPHEQRPDGAEFYVLWCSRMVAEWAASVGFPQPFDGPRLAHMAGHTYEDCTAWMMARAEAGT